MENLKDNLNEDGIKEDKVKDGSLEDLIKKNIEISEEILSLSKYVKKYVFWQRIMGILKLFIILIPIVLAFIYLPPFLREVSSYFRSLMGLSENLGESSNVFQNFLK